LAIAEAYGHPLHAELVPSRMLELMNDHKPSLLQDYERSRRMELAEIVLAPLEMARATGTPAPVLQALASVTCRLARDRGLLDPPEPGSRGAPEFLSL
jgi:2-dehydropantoate 2-reductase